MKQINGLAQGSPEWHAHRARCFNASDAPAMMGVSPYKTRTELLDEYKTGIRPEPTPDQQRLFDRGHAAEAANRPVAEEIIGEELYPVCGEIDVDGLSRPLGSSFDGLTMLQDVNFEHKLYSNAKALLVQAGTLPEQDYWQVVQQFALSGAERTLYMIGEGDKREYCWVNRPPASDVQKLLDGWKQFDADLADHVPAVAKMEAVGSSPDNLPSLQIQVTGMVQSSNLDEFKNHAIAVFDGIKTDLATDQDFADAESTVKWCKTVEDQLKEAKKRALEQTSSIDELFKAIDEISAKARDRRLALDKLVKAKKDECRANILAEVKSKFASHIDGLNDTLGKIRMPDVPVDFIGAMKGKQKIDSLQDAVDTELARAKIAANELHGNILANVNLLREKSEGYAGLFADAQVLVTTKSADDLSNVIAVRIGEHKQAEKAKLDAERERIEAEEAAKAKQAETPPAAEKNPVIPARQASVEELPSIKLGDINSAIAPLKITAEGLSSLGFEPAGKERSSVLYRGSDFELICRALVNHINGSQIAKLEKAA